MFPSPCVAHSLCSPVPILPRPHSPQSLCLPVPMPPVLMLPMFPSPDVPQKCFHVAILQQIFAWYLQSLRSPKMLASPYVTQSTNMSPVPIFPKHVVQSLCPPNLSTSRMVPHTFPKFTHDDVIKCNNFPRYWPFVRGIHRSPVNSPHKGQWRGALMFSLIYV